MITEVRPSTSGVSKCNVTQDKVVQNKWTWGLLLTSLVVGGLGLIMFGFLQKRPVVVYSPVLLPVALTYLLPADHEIALHLKQFTPSFQNHLVLMIRNFLSRVIHGYLVHFSLLHIFHISPCNSFPSRINASLL